MGKIFQGAQWMDATKIQISKKRIEKHLVLEPHLHRLHCAFYPVVSQRYSHIVKACIVCATLLQVLLLFSSDSLTSPRKQDPNKVIMLPEHSKQSYGHKSSGKHH